VRWRGSEVWVARVPPRRVTAVRALLLVMWWHLLGVVRLVRLAVHRPLLRWHLHGWARIALLRVIIRSLRGHPILILANWRRPVASHALSSIGLSRLVRLGSHCLRAWWWPATSKDVGKGSVALAWVGRAAIAIALSILSTLLRAVVRHQGQHSAPGPDWQGRPSPVSM
jgi:hypothetical protein